MQISRALKIRDAAVTALRDVYSHASHFGLTSKEMETRKHAALDRVGARKAPRWVMSFLEGYWKCVIDRAYGYQGDLIYGAYIKGVFYSTHSGRDDYYERHGMGAKEFAELHSLEKTGGHYWVNLKPFFTQADY